MRDFIEAPLFDLAAERSARRPYSRSMPSSPPLDRLHRSRMVREPKAPRVQAGGIVFMIQQQCLNRDETAYWTEAQPRGGDRGRHGE